MGINRRNLLAGASALAAMPNGASALTPAQQLLLMGQSGGALPAPPSGFVYLLGADGAYLLGADGAYLLGVAP